MEGLPLNGLNGMAGHDANGTNSQTERPFERLSPAPHLGGWGKHPDNSIPQNYVGAPDSLSETNATLNPPRSTPRNDNVEYSFSKNQNPSVDAEPTPLPSTSSPLPIVTSHYESPAPVFGASVDHVVQPLSLAATQSLPLSTNSSNDCLTSTITIPVNKQSTQPRVPSTDDRIPTTHVINRHTGQNTSMLYDSSQQQRMLESFRVANEAAASQAALYNISRGFNILGGTPPQQQQQQQQHQRQQHQHQQRQQQHPHHQQQQHQPQQQQLQQLQQQQQSNKPAQRDQLGLSPNHARLQLQHLARRQQDLEQQRQHQLRQEEHLQQPQPQYLVEQHTNAAHKPAPVHDMGGGAMQFPEHNHTGLANGNGNLNLNSLSAHPNPALNRNMGFELQQKISMLHHQSTQLQQMNGMPYSNSNSNSNTLQAPPPSTFPFASAGANTTDGTSIASNVASLSGNGIGGNKSNTATGNTATATATLNTNAPVSSSQGQGRLQLLDMDDSSNSAQQMNMLNSGLGSNSMFGNVQLGAQQRQAQLNQSSMQMGFNMANGGMGGLDMSLMPPINPMNNLPLVGMNSMGGQPAMNNLGMGMPLNLGGHLGMYQNQLQNQMQVHMMHPAYRTVPVQGVTAPKATRRRTAGNRKCWLCVVYGTTEEEKKRVQMKWQAKIGKLMWADGHQDNFCPSLNGRATIVQAAAAKRAWSQARSKRSEYFKYMIDKPTKPAKVTKNE